MNRKSIRINELDVARWLSITWACGWVYFALASGFAEGAPADQIAVQTVLATIVFLGSVGAAWQWKLSGGLLLMAEGTLFLVAYPLLMSSRIPVNFLVVATAVLALPPLIAGVLFVRSGWTRHRPHFA